MKAADRWVSWVRVRHDTHWRKHSGHNYVLIAEFAGLVCEAVCGGRSMALPRGEKPAATYRRTGTPRVVLGGSVAAGRGVRGTDGE
jgi:hypothetical protein